MKVHRSTVGTKYGSRMGPSGCILAGKLIVDADDYEESVNGSEYVDD